jgi:hypothetical protein
MAVRGTARKRIAWEAAIGRAYRWGMLRWVRGSGSQIEAARAAFDAIDD